MGIIKFLQKHIIIANLLLALFIVCVLAVGILFWLDVYTRHGKTVEVPDVKGLLVEESAPFFQNKSLRYVVADSLYVKRSKPGTILETTPPIGTAVKEGRTIYLTISSYYAKLYTIPDVMDMSQRQAISLLRSTGFENVQVKTVPGAFRDLVVGLETRGQNVSIGDKVLSDALLMLLVSSGEGGGEEESVDENPAEEPEDSSDNWF
jgi:beta-lactam-binding protein with PASTA domain